MFPLKKIGKLRNSFTKIQFSVNFNWFLQILAKKQNHLKVLTLFSNFYYFPCFFTYFPKKKSCFFSVNLIFSWFLWIFNEKTDFFSNSSFTEKFPVYFLHIPIYLLNFSPNKPYFRWSPTIRWRRCRAALSPLSKPMNQPFFAGKSISSFSNGAESTKSSKNWLEIPQ